MQSITIQKEINERSVLRKFKMLYDACNADEREYMTVKKILNICDKEEVALIAIFKNRYNIDLSIKEAEEMKYIVKSYFFKSDVRKRVPEDRKKKLLRRQGDKCAICGKKITIHDHADHIIPFLYVGDCLNDINLQMLCAKCNRKKRASLNYQVRFVIS